MSSDESTAKSADEASRAKFKDDTKTETADDLVDNSIDPDNEIVGVKLLLIHIGVTLAAFLAGPVSMTDTHNLPTITS